MKKGICIIAVLAAAALLSGCEGGGNSLDPVTQPEEVTLNVDVILPPAIQAQWENVIGWAQENIAKAQQRQSRKIRLNLRYHDEDTEDLDKLGYALTHPEAGADTCHAVIGPYHSSNAMEVLKYAKQTRLPVIMPTCTSAELQRINARNTYAWFLTESDITQCEIMLSAAQALHATDVALICSGDTYGQSFLDWFAYYATERELHIAGGAQVYKPGEDLRPFLRTVAEESEGTEVWMLIALSRAEDYIAVSNAVEDFWADEILFEEKELYIRTICANTALDETVLLSEDMLNAFNLGVSPVGSMNYGFPQAYMGYFSRLPLNGETQVYDALTLLALGAAARLGSPDRCLVDGVQVAYSEKPYEPGLTDYMRSVISSGSGPSVQWDATTLATAFDELAQGRSIDLSGATGALFTDSDTHTKVLNTTYMLWQLMPHYDEQDVPHPAAEPILYLSTAGTSNEASTTEFWKLEKQWAQEFSHDDAPAHELPRVTDHWAVVISPSTKWSNYRHQADAFAMYRSLRQHGYDDDHIVLIVEDNLSADSRNVFPGKIYVERSETPSDDPLVNEDVREGAVVDYHFTDLQPADLADILLGRESARLPQVIHPAAGSDVLFFWSGHGGSREGPLWGDEDANTYFGTTRIRDIVQEMNEKDIYRRLILVIETCYSGKWGQAVEGIPDVLALTAASPNETSKADVHDRDLGVYLSNAFARTFRRGINANPGVSIYDLYKELARTTTGSHVTLYNNAQYGSVYSETMRDYFPQ